MLKYLRGSAVFGIAFLGVCVANSFAADLPPAKTIFEKMGMGINIGNTMEVPQNPTWWGNKFPTEAYIDSVKAAGFNTIRIPCAWYSHSNAMSRDSSKADLVPGGDDTAINPGWMDSVQTVVDRCMRAGLVTILNIHWDNGWLESQLNDESKDKVNARQKGFWTQIAEHFKDYNENLLFASANEPATTDGNYKHESEILETYHQTFVDAVRATGGNNASRTLIVQGPSTSIDRSVEVMPVSKLPKDKIEGRLMFEVHYYDPSPYTIVGDPVNWGVEVQPQYYWGEENYATGADAVHNCGYNPWGGGMGTPCSADDMQKAFNKMKVNYVDKGVPVIIGEYGANDRTGILTGENLAKHRKGLVGYYTAIAKAARDNQVVPIAWDTGHEGENNMTIIRRQTEPDGSVFDLGILNALRGVYGLGDYENKGVTHVENFAGESKTDANVERVADFAERVGLQNRLQRDGNILRSSTYINLFDLNGQLVCSSLKNNSYYEILLEGVRSGLYVAKSANAVMKVEIK